MMENYLIHACVDTGIIRQVQIHNFIEGVEPMENQFEEMKN